MNTTNLRSQSELEFSNKMYQGYKAMEDSDGEPESAEEAGMEGELSEGYNILRFITGGNAYFTLVSKRTDKRITYRVSRKEKQANGEDPMWFVSVLTGPANTRDYTYMGLLIHTLSGKFVIRHTAKSGFRPDSDAFKGFVYIMDRVSQGLDAGGLHFHHMGRCAACGRPLTVPESILTGFGPICLDKMMS